MPFSIWSGSRTTTPRTPRMRKANLNNRIRVFRAEHRMSQSDLANLIGVSRKTISTIEVVQLVPEVSVVGVPEEMQGDLDDA